jgi:hypothetical protein
MADVRDTLRAALAADVTLAALLTGGIYDANVMNADGLPVATAYDANGILKPSLVVRWRGGVPGSILEFTETRTCELYFYSQQGYSVISQAQARCKVLLHRKQLPSVTGTGLNYFEWVNDLGEYQADELHGAAADMSRYSVSLSVNGRK